MKRAAGRAPLIGLAAVCIAAWTAVAADAPGSATAPLSLNVTITVPGMNDVLAAGSTMTLTAESAGAVRVEFFNGDKSLGVATAPPFTIKFGAGRLAAGNYLLTAKAADAQGRTAASPAITVTCTERAPWDVATYDYAETGEDVLKELRLALPKHLPVLRGLFVYTNGAGGDTRDAWKAPYLKEFLSLHGFGFIGAKAFNSHQDSVEIFDRALVKFAEASGHPEVARAPIVLYGFSAGGGFAVSYGNHAPARVIAVAPISAPTRLGADELALATPVCMVGGELEPKLIALESELFPAAREKHALYAWMALQDTPHKSVGQQVMAWPFLDHAIRLRLPADVNAKEGRVALRPLVESGGWLAEQATRKSGPAGKATAPLTEIAAFGDYKGDKAKASWLPDKDIAFIYRAYATYDKPLKIVSPSPDPNNPQVFSAGSNVTIVVDDSAFADWKKLEFYNGAEKLGEITQRPARCTVRSLAPGICAFSVLGTAADGAVRTSQHVLAVVSASAPALR